ncbi:hypothetical protein THRCLA_06961 [Thraustotheca clavata]|uniref:Uncharacterized protein n=1 Tax=Thraustotheca clavata TaxID=74557 RepID=A0A1V9ZHG2_9STRA|nr:hypothetical protein THRCLA_06961 [Thraustotheca clavata]
MANDYFWAGFNTTGGYAFLANFYNHQLFINSNEDLLLDSDFYIDYSQSYNNSVSTIFWAPSAAKRALHNPNVITIVSAITGFRAMDACKLPWMFTQYCWLDFNQIWSLASTNRREQRYQNMSSNAAMYVEAGLRNIRDWKSWDNCWGTSFNIGINNYLKTSSQGQAWLYAIKTNTNSQMRCHNGNHIIYNILICSLTYSLLLSRIPHSFHPTQQTLMLMYWLFASDLWAVSTNLCLIGGMSPIRSSSNFAFNNISSKDILIQKSNIGKSSIGWICSIEKSTRSIQIIL